MEWNAARTVHGVSPARLPTGHRHHGTQADALGMETRNVSNAYFMPVLSSKGSGSLDAARAAGISVSVFHDPAHHGNLSPKALTTMRTTRMLQSLGQKVIFSNDPYVTSAFESLITSRVDSGGPAPTRPELAELMARKPPSGRLRAHGSKAAALKRAKRLVGMGANVTAEVPFADALRVCDLERDRSALPALLRAYVFNKPRIIIPKLEEYCEVLSKQKPRPKLQATALLMQQGFFFAAIKVGLCTLLDAHGMSP